MINETITREWVEDRLDTLYPMHVEALVRLLTVLRGLFDGDLDTMLVLAATSISTRGEGWREMLFEGRSLRAVGNPTNTQSIAHLTQIPRETVRRKLVWLQARGWVRRDDQGNWRPTPEAVTALEPGSQATVIYLKTLLGAAQRCGSGTASPAARK